MRGPTGTHYLNNAEAQAKTVRDGWNVFQDLVAWDKDGCLIYIARRDEMIVSGGHSISPVEVEQVLMRHPYVAECACTAAPDPAGLRPSIVKAYIVLKSTVEQSATTKLELQGFFKRSAPPFMYPREIEFKDSLPRTLNGKIPAFRAPKTGGAGGGDLDHGFRETDHIQRVVIPARRVSAGPHDHSRRLWIPE